MSLIKARTRASQLACTVLLLGVAACGPEPAGQAQTASSPQSAPAPSATASSAASPHAVPAGARFIERFQSVLTVGKTYRAVIEMAKGGEFEITFHPEIAPNHVANFVSLARLGFYNGVTFHRVIEGFMAQGGDPTGSGGGGPGYTIPAEFSNTPHRRGTVSMARTSDPNSAGSQFFICFQDTPFLDGQYTAFGSVTRGMDVVDAIRKRDPDRATFQGDAIRTVRIIEE